ncbi:MAG: hypothetical protein NTZ13_00765 [Candidatus Parcubacteria bacterium]|nr:hypothetical protein [Candidatus Parcubacteria bacterium]
MRPNLFQNRELYYLPVTHKQNKSIIWEYPNKTEVVRYLKQHQNLFKKDSLLVFTGTAEWTRSLSVEGYNNVITNLQLPKYTNSPEIHDQIIGDLLQGKERVLIVGSVYLLNFPYAWFGVSSSLCSLKQEVSYAIAMATDEGVIYRLYFESGNPFHFRVVNTFTGEDVHLDLSRSKETPLEVCREKREDFISGEPDPCILDFFCGEDGACG